MCQFLSMSAQQVHGDIRHLEITRSTEKANQAVHGDIRHLESEEVA